MKPFVAMLFLFCISILSSQKINQEVKSWYLWVPGAVIANEKFRGLSKS